MNIEKITQIQKVLSIFVSSMYDNDIDPDETAEKACDIKDDESLIQFLQTAAKILAKADSRVAVDIHAGSIAQKYGISKDVMLAEIRRYRRRFAKGCSGNEK